MEQLDAKNVISLIEAGRRNDFSISEIIGDIIVYIPNNRTINLQGSNIKGKVVLNASDYININFKDATFSNEVSIDILRGRVDMKGATFTSGLSIKASEQYILDISDTKLAGEINISNSKFSSIDLSGIDFIRKEEYDKFIFEHNEIQSKTNGSRSTFQNASFNETKFSGIVTFDNSTFLYSTKLGSGNFHNCLFEQDAYFNNVNFEKGAFFNGANFKGVAIFTAVNKNVKCDGDFSGVSFEKRSFFDNSVFVLLTFRNCSFNDVASFRHFSAKELQISQATFIKGSDFLNANIQIADKETFRIIKNEFLKINNQIEALCYHSKEMKAYEKELKIDGYWEDKLLLWLHRNSNEYGLNWRRGIVFTFIVALIFYIPYFLLLNTRPFEWGWVSWPSFWDAAGETVKYFFKFFLPTHYFDFMDDFGPNAINYLLDFLGRIFIGYGIYQTIQAFRKYGKG